MRRNAKEEVSQRTMNAGYPAGGLSKEAQCGKGNAGKIKLSSRFALLRKKDVMLATSLIFRKGGDKLWNFKCEDGGH